MYTDVYFTNRTPSGSDQVGLVFFQRQTAATQNTSRIFRTIEQCPSGWSHLVRIPWNLNFRLVSTNGNFSDLRPLENVYKEGSKKYLLFKEGTLVLQQRYMNGRQYIEFEQLKGKPCAGIKLFRGDFLIAELYFNTCTICFQVDDTINLCHFYNGSEGDPIPEAAIGLRQREFSFGLTGLKEICLQLNASAPQQLTESKTVLW